jgi:xanthine dehydrogenase YagS FAD-binding subunit
VLYELPDFEHADARTVEEAIGWLAQYGNRAKILAGGTDLLGLMKDRISGPKMPLPDLLVNIKTIPGFDRIECPDAGGATIGPTATLFDIESHPIIRMKFAGLAEAARSVATTSIRYVGTIGGNLCQRPWCWYFRHPDFVCFKRGGRQCYALPGHNRTYFSILNLGVCVMSHPSDLAVALLALDARIVIAGPQGNRTVAAERFFLGPRSVSETVLGSDELILRIEIDEPALGSRSVYVKHRPRNTWDFALSAVGVSVTQQDGRCTEARVVLGGVAPLPYRVRAAEDALREQHMDARTIERAAEAAVASSRPLPMNGYKVALTRALVGRALKAVARPVTV